MRLFLRSLLSLVCLFSVAPSWGDVPNFRMQVVPAVVYKVDDPGGAHTSSFVFNVAVLCSTDCDLTPVSAHLDHSSAGSSVERQDWTAATLAQIRRMSYRIGTDTPLASPTRAFTLPEAFDLRFAFRHPQALAIDSCNDPAHCYGRARPTGGTDIEHSNQLLPTEDFAHRPVSRPGRGRARLDHEWRPWRLLERFCPGPARPGRKLRRAEK